MSGSKYFDKICWIVIACALVLTVLFMNGEKLGLSVIHSNTEETTEEGSYFSNKDLDCGWDTASITEVVMNGTSGTSTGNGASFCEGDLVITQGGYYSISGDLTDGSIIVNVSKKYKVYLQLNGVTINCSDDACIRVEKADKVFITLAADSANSLTSGSEFSQSALADGTDGAIFSHSDLTINGEGTLEIATGYGNGIAANDDLVITGGAITIDAPEDAVHANDSFRLCNASLTLSAGDDAIHTDGDLQISGGTITITGCYEGIEGESITIDDGTITVTSSDDGINGGEITINGGEITILNESGMDADGIDSNGDFIMNGGRLLISVTSEGMSSAIDYGSESGGVCQINGGIVIACGSNGMLETLDSSSLQVSILYSLDTKEETGSQVSLLDSEGNTLLNYTPPYSYSAVLVSCQSLTLGETYTLICGDSQTEITPDSNAYSNVNSMGMGSGMAGGMGMNSGMASAPAMGNTGDAAEGSTEMPDMQGTQDSSDSSAMQQMPDMQGTQDSSDSSAMPQMPDMQGGQAPGGQGFAGATDSTDSSASTDSSDNADSSAMQQMPDMQNGWGMQGGQAPAGQGFAGSADSNDPAASSESAASSDPAASSEMPEMSQDSPTVPAGGNMRFSAQGWNEDLENGNAIDWNTVLPVTLASLLALVAGIIIAALFRRR